jgi:hypothetical protein
MLWAMGLKPEPMADLQAIGSDDDVCACCFDLSMLVCVCSYYGLLVCVFFFFGVFFLLIAFQTLAE